MKHKKRASEMIFNTYTHSSRSSRSRVQLNFNAHRSAANKASKTSLTTGPSGKNKLHFGKGTVSFDISAKAESTGRHNEGDQQQL
ncbi:unnamed protein product [Ceratitis capitata]|uniref:(Mediterranean fruit fly) hypothetical protein n=1 Tax=Ceratitis capitata TaxID=7213 RepID=A0A811VBW8_CERCA|nr:unnamed protein product [Ceratitis capitata]